MCMTSHQHENIARGSNSSYRRKANDKIAYSLGYVGWVQFKQWWDEPTTTGTYLSNRLGNKKVTTTN